MNSNEEYLDNLLKQMGGTGDGEEPKKDPNSIMSADEIEAMFAAAEKVAGDMETPKDESKSEAIEESPMEAFPEEESKVEEPIVEEPIIEEPLEESLSQEVSDEDASVLNTDDIEKLLQSVSDDNYTQEETSETEAIQESKEAPSLESTMDMSADDIEKLLNESDSGKEETDISKEDDKSVEDDLDALLQSLNQNDDIKEINELLNKADNNETIEQTDNEIQSQETDDLLNAINADETKQKKVKKGLFGKKKKNQDTEESEEVAKKAEEASTDDLPVKEKKAKREKKSKKAVSIDNATENSESNTEKKPHFFGKFIQTLTAEDEDEVDGKSENQSILDELTIEDQEEANKKKKIKKGKMPTKPSSGDEEGEDGKPIDKKGKKAKKTPKPKKEKPPKAVKEKIPEKPGKRVSKKSVCVIIIFSGSVFAALFFGIFLGSSLIQKDGAVKAFNKQDYLTCYEMMYGMDLSEKEKTMFKHAEVVLKIQRRVDMYDRYMYDDFVLEAVDSLMQALANYEDLYAEAKACGAENEVQAIYVKILGILQDDYGLNEDEARTIADCKSNVDYTRYLTALVGGQTSTPVDTIGDAVGDVLNDGLVIPEQEMQDILPAEQELGEPDFVN